MNKGLLFLINILRNKVIINNNTIPVIKRSYPDDKTPCITIDDSGSSVIINKRLINKKIELPSTHPQYIQGKLFPQQFLATKYNISLNINIWANNGAELDNITESIKELLFKLEKNHYMYCCRYNNGQCSYLSNNCQAVNNLTDKKGNKSQCPNPTTYNYSNLFNLYDIDRKTFYYEEPFSLDDLTLNPPIRRNIIKVNFSYTYYKNIGGTIQQDLTIDEDII